MCDEREHFTAADGASAKPEFQPLSSYKGDVEKAKAMGKELVGQFSGRDESQNAPLIMGIPEARAEVHLDIWDWDWDWKEPGCGMIYIAEMRSLGSGWGGNVAMRQLCDLADKHDVHLVLDAMPFGPRYIPDQDKLVKWYGYFGFIPTSEPDLVSELCGREMVRPPRTNLRSTSACR